MDTLVSMMVFRHIVESGSFVAAAERMNLSTAMTTNHVKYLEKRLGTRLLNRNSRSLSLTEPGNLYFGVCKLILEELEQAESAVGTINAVPRGTLRITCCPSWASTHDAANLLAAYGCRYPEILVDISFAERFVDIVEEGYDLAIRCTADPLPAALIARRLRSVPFVIAASPEYLERRGEPKSVEDLAKHDCVMVGSGQSWDLAGPNGRVRIPARVVLRFCSATAAVAHAVVAGIGLAALPLSVIEEPLFKGRLRPVLAKHPLRQPDLYALYVSRKHMPAKIRTFIDHCVEYFGVLPPARLPDVIA
jgi:DNA-binding transcriptional LysR family regulator